MQSKLKAKKTFKWQDYVLIGIIILSFFLNFWALYKEGYSNEYYAASVKSMLTNIKAFFYGSFDSGLFVTVDKPPLGLWIQALSCKIFGVNSFGLILPSALAGSMCVLLVYSMVKKIWGDTAGIISAAIVATTPILVALSRTNNLDMMLLFFLLCGAKFILKASKTQSLKYYILAMILVGLGFNIKMLQAFMVVPAFLLIYFLGKGKLAKKLLHTIIALVVLLGISFSWALIVDSIPTDERPYIGSSSTNSVMNLILDYNGLNRLTGNTFGSRSSGMGIDSDGLQSSYFSELSLENEGLNSSSEMPTAPSGETSQIGPGQNSNGNQTADGLQMAPPENADGNQQNINNQNSSFEQSTDGRTRDGSFDNDQDGQDGQRSGNGGMMAGGGGGAGGESESGTRGVFRLFSEQLAGLISWFLLPALGAMVFAGICLIRWFIKRKQTPMTDEDRDKVNSMVFWSAWLLPMAVFFSIGGFIHRYYVVMLTPSIAALAAIAAVAVYRSKYKKWLMPLAFIATLAVQCYIVSRTNWSMLCIPMAAVGTVGLALFFLKKEILKRISAVLMLIALFIAPIAWSITPLIYTGNSNIPNAGPDMAMNNGFNAVSLGNLMSGQFGGLTNTSNNENTSQTTQISEGLDDSTKAIDDTKTINGDRTNSNNTVLYKYLLENYNGERWIIAVSSSNDAAPLILETGLPVMAMGGFSGSDSILTLQQFKEYVYSGELRYYYANSSRGQGDSSEIASWVKENGKALELSNGTTIYDLSGLSE